MERKIICFGVRDYEIPTFLNLGKKYNYELILKKEYVTNDNYEDALGFEIIMVRANCDLNKDTLLVLKEAGLKVILTRSVGYNHLDILACKSLNIEVAYVPGYSPSSVAELAVTLAMMLIRHTAYITNKTSLGDFRIDSVMFSKEIRNSVVGIIGLGRIGYTAYRIFKGLGAKVIAYDINPKPDIYEDVEYMPLNELLSTADIISIHVPYIKGVNENFINKDLINKMKKGAILVNTSRGELQDLNSILDAVESNHLDGVALDVIANEREIFFKKYQMGENKLYDRMINLYPKVIITPHIGSATDMALNDMIEISLQNMDEYFLNNKCKNSLIK